MNLSLRIKFSATIIGVALLAFLSSTVALLSTWHIGRLMRDTVQKDVPSFQAAGQLQMALCEPRGFLASYILEGGNPKWLQQLQEEKLAFNSRLAETRAAVRSSEQQENLDELEKAYREYEAARDEVVLHYRHGDADGAKRVLLGDVNELYQKAYDQVENFVTANQRKVDVRMAHVRAEMAWVTGLVAASVALTAGLGTLLLWLFFHGVLRPLRAMMADAREFSGSAAAVDHPQDELGAVGDYLRALMSDMADTRSNLEWSHRQLLQSEKLVSVGKLAASVAHEIRNPLTAMKMWLFSVRKAVGGDPEVDHSLDIVPEEMARLESIVRNFLEFSRPPALKIRQLCMGDVIDKTLDLARHQIAEKQIVVHQERAPELPSVMADPEQLKQVLINLLSNAVEATPEHGRIRLHATAEGDRQNEPMVVVRVHDSGSGIPQELQSRVFEPFFTTKEQGTGLGLCIAAQVMGQHGGRLVLESSNDQGTSFAVWMPAAGTDGNGQDSRC